MQLGNLTPRLIDSVGQRKTAWRSICLPSAKPMHITVPHPGMVQSLGYIYKGKYVENGASDKVKYICVILSLQTV